MIRNFPDATIVRDATFRYNCFGFALASSHGWFEISETFFNDDFSEVSMDTAEAGDVLVYTKNGTVRHTAVVTRVEDNEIVQLRSKWGAMPEVLHSLRHVSPKYGEPTFLLRRLPGAMPHFDFAGELEEREREMVEESISEAIRRFSDEDVYMEVLLASTQETRRVIIESLPGVQELVETGSAAGKAILDLFQKEETQNNHELSAISLYLLRRLPSAEAARSLASYIRSGRSLGLNSELAAQAFLASAGIEALGEDPVSVAFRESERFL